MSESMGGPARRAGRSATLAWVVAVAAACALFATGGDWASAWTDGVRGFEEAFRDAQQEKRPVFVYFYTDWCGYCRQLESELLADEKMMSYLGSISAVRINPELGAADQSLARRYGVNSYPSLFFHPDGRPDEYAAVRRTVMDGGRLRLKTADEFISGLTASGG